MKNNFQTLIKIVKPFQLICIVMTYLLGGGLVQYVRGMKSWQAFFEGLGFLVLTYLFIEGLYQLYQWRNLNNCPKGIGDKEIKTNRLIIGMASATFITAAMTIIINWFQTGIFWQGLLILLLIFGLIASLYYLTKTKIILKNFDLLSEALLVIVIPPALSFFLQSTDMHFLLTMVVIPLIPSYLSNRILVYLKNFDSNYKLRVDNIVTLIGWEQAMVLHNTLILMTYFLFALMALLGFPWFLLWPVFLTLPIGALQIWLMERVKRGGKPFWVIMQIAALCVLVIPIYLIGFAFWIR